MSHTPTKPNQTKPDQTKEEKKRKSSKLPILVNGLDCPFEFLPECLGEELLNGYVELLGEDDGESRVDVVLIINNVSRHGHSNKQASR